MKSEHRKALEPYSKLILQMNTMVGESTPEELQELAEACARATTTNCGWYEYQAAKQIEGEVRYIISSRHHALLKS